MASLLLCYCRRVLRRGRGVLGRGLRLSRRAPGQGAPMLVGVPQLSSSGTGAAAGALLLSSVSPAGRNRAGLGLECRCLRMKGKTLWAERGQRRRGPPQRPGESSPCPHRFLVSGGMMASARRFL